MWFMFRTSGEEQEKAKKDTLEMLKIVEEIGLRDFKEKKFFGGDKINLVDIAFCGFAHWLGVIEDVVGMKLLEAEKFPRLYAWIKKFQGSSSY
ncbi:hypothetical protein Patl1_25809 [Pistacia atlantica]|uniref:Uncharacterized protein n=1 Tax=Pistacia atlantica TaxID=434234 RepID=A0ACC1B1B3_9ROSI|nr:hypothetical protein Patl1_25809 [Pistacia atlantica]